MHMKDALDKLIADFRSYAGEHGGTFGGQGCANLPPPQRHAAQPLIILEASLRTGARA